jgi:hypothetical protein
MKKYFYLAVLVAWSNLSNLSPALAKPRAINAIGKIQDTREVIGSGCSILKSPKSQDVVFWSTDSKEALMNIDGKDRKLKLVSETQPTGRGKKGDRWISTYQAGKIVVKIDRVTTFVCPVGDQECEVTRYAITINLRIGDRRETLKTVGDCGS